MGTMPLISAEFIPVSLPMPIARDLAVSNGMTGQTVTPAAGINVMATLMIAISFSLFAKAAGRKA